MPTIFRFVATLQLLLLAVIFVLDSTLGQEPSSEDRTCLEIYGPRENWPPWVPDCFNNGTCWLYLPAPEDRYPFPYCVCEPPFSGMSCESYDWSRELPANAGSNMVAIISAVIGTAVFFLLIIALIWYRKERSKKLRGTKESIDLEREEERRGDEVYCNRSCDNIDGPLVQTWKPVVETISVKKVEFIHQFSQPPPLTPDATTPAPQLQPNSENSPVANKTTEADELDGKVMMLELPIVRRVHTNLMSSRAGSVRVSQVLPPDEVIPFIDDWNDS